MTEVKFIFNTDLVNELVKLITNAKHKLILISPFIDLSPEIKAALDTHKLKHDFELLVLFGKNEGNIYKSVKKDSFEYLKGFPNIDIRYEERLHAKFYQNDFDYIMTSINLYDYSLAKNIEVGIIANYASEGLLGKAMDGADSIINIGADKVKQDILGIRHKDTDPIEEFEKIFNSAEKKYKSEPIIGNEDGIMGSIKGSLGYKTLKDRKVLYDYLLVPTKEIKEPKEKIGFVSDFVPITNKTEVDSSSVKVHSANTLSKTLNVTKEEILNVMQNAGLINGNKITSAGQAKGLVMKKHMGNDYIAFPENLAELKLISK